MGDWKLVAARDEQWKLFNIPAEHTEVDEVSTEHPKKMTELQSGYDAWVKRCGVERWPIKDD
jgi:arylsulfatase